MRHKGLIALVVSVVIGLLTLGVWFLKDQFEWHTESIRTGYSLEAIRNQYLTLELWFKRMGCEVVSRTSLPRGDDLPPTTDTLVLVQRVHPMSPQQADELFHWVERGGFLIFETDLDHKSGKTDAPGSLVRRDALRQAFHLEFLCSTDEKDNFHYWKSTTPQSLHFEGEDESSTFQVEFNEHHRLKDLDDPTETPRYSLSCQRGEGEALAFTELSFLRNASLGKWDHAEFFWHALNEPTGKIWIVRGEERESLWAWLGQNARPTLLAFVVLLLGVLWHFLPRFGPLMPAPDAARRSLLEHVDATARFLWREGEARRLVQRTRAAMWKRLSLAHPAWTALPEVKLRNQLAEFTGESEMDIFRALSQNDFAHPREYTHVIQILENLRKRL